MRARPDRGRPRRRQGQHPRIRGGDGGGGDQGPGSLPPVEGVRWAGAPVGHDRRDAQTARREREHAEEQVHAEHDAVVEGAVAHAEVRRDHARQDRDDEHAGRDGEGLQARPVVGGPHADDAHRGGEREQHERVDDDHDGPRLLALEVDGPQHGVVHARDAQVDQAGEDERHGRRLDEGQAGIRPTAAGREIGRRHGAPFPTGSTARATPSRAAPTTRSRKCPHYIGPSPCVHSETGFLPPRRSGRMGPDTQAARRERASHKERR